MQCKTQTRKPCRGQGKTWKKSESTLKLQWVTFYKKNFLSYLLKLSVHNTDHAWEKKSYSSGPFVVLQMAADTNLQKTRFHQAVRYSSIHFFSVSTEQYGSVHFSTRFHCEKFWMVPIEPYRSVPSPASANMTNFFCFFIKVH